jgi:hypothetical protein
VGDHNLWNGRAQPMRNLGGFRHLGDLHPRPGCGRAL